MVDENTPLHIIVRKSAIYKSEYDVIETALSLGADVWASNKGNSFSFLFYSLYLFSLPNICYIYNLVGKHPIDMMPCSKRIVSILSGCGPGVTHNSCENFCEKCKDYHFYGEYGSDDDDV